MSRILPTKSLQLTCYFNHVFGYQIEDSSCVRGLNLRARGGGGAGGGGLHPPPHFFGNFKELLRKRCFQPPHFQSSSAGPESVVWPF